MNVVALAQGYVLKTKLMAKKPNFLSTCERAIAKFEDALQTMPDNKQVLVHLADLYNTKKDFQTANDYYQAALAVDPTDCYTKDRYEGFLASWNVSSLASMMKGNASPKARRESNKKESVSPVFL